MKKQTFYKNHPQWLAPLLGLLALFSTSAANSASFLGLGSAVVIGPLSGVKGISADGSVVVGGSFVNKQSV